MELTELIPGPDFSSVNVGKTPCPTAYLEREYGRPRTQISENCQDATTSFWKSRMVTKDFGIFKVRGHRLLIKHLESALEELKVLHPEVYNALGHVGALCVRWVRGSKTVLSNHSFGLAIDLTLNGRLDPYGDGKVQRGLLILYSVLKNHGFYWGYSFGRNNPKREDAMHFEICAEVVMQAINDGTF